MRVWARWRKCPLPVRMNSGSRRKGYSGKVRDAGGGILFLDEIGDMPLLFQARLLRVIQERIVSPLGGRIVSGGLCADLRHQPRKRDERSRRGVLRGSLLSPERRADHAPHSQAVEGSPGAGCSIIHSLVPADGASRPACWRWISSGSTPGRPPSLEVDLPLVPFTPRKEGKKPQKNSRKIDTACHMVYALGLYRPSANEGLSEAGGAPEPHTLESGGRLHA